MIPAKSTQGNRPALQGNAVFLQINQIEDHELLSCFKEPLTEDEDKRTVLNGFIESWEPESSNTEEREARLIEFLVFACTENTLITDNPQNLEEICHVLFYFLYSVEDAPSQERKEELYEKLAAWLTSTVKVADLQMEMCSILLNLIPRCDDVAPSLLQPKEQKERNRRWGNCRGRVFAIMLKFAQENNLGELFREILTKSLFESWLLEDELHANLLLGSYRLFNKTSIDAIEEAHQFLLEYLRKRPQESPIAFRAVLNVLASEANSPRALMEVFSLDAVRRLPNNPQYKPIYNLLDLLYQGNVDDYKRFLDTEENLECVKGIGLYPEKIKFKIQQLTLCDLGREEPLQNLEELRIKLDCEDLRQVERVVQAAQQQGLLEALFDYSQNTLRLHKVALRVFTNQQDNWEGLSRKLEHWAVQTKTIRNYSHVINCESQI